jgi:hypothetical protein
MLIVPPELAARFILGGRGRRADQRCACDAIRPAAVVRAVP